MQNKLIYKVFHVIWDVWSSCSTCTDGILVQNGESFLILKRTFELSSSSFSFPQSYSLMTLPLILQSSRTVSYLNNSLHTAGLFSPLFAFLHHAGLTAELPPFISVFALMPDTLLYGLHLDMWAKVSWLPSQLSSTLQQFNRSCSESSLKNYFSLSRR